MSADTRRLRFLLERYRLNQSDPAEMAELEEILKEDWREIDFGSEPKGIGWDEMYARIINQAAVIEMKPETRFTWRKLAAACIIVFMISGVAWLLLNKSKTKMEQPVAVADITAPSINRATITLGNGRKVFLDSAVSGQVAMQNQVLVIKSKTGLIIYNANNHGPAKESVYNTLSNPRGSQPIEIALSDGTRVWLNAGSSMTYPVAFAEKERSVAISGEAYFEVAHDISRAFHVLYNHINIQVLGTHFNVNAYDDEPGLAVTLLEGSVKVSDINLKLSETIKPGQQAKINGNKMEVLSGINEEEVMAWKNGFFHFESADLKTILRQFSRWYDVDIEYRSDIPADKYFVIINRKSSLSDVLKALQTTGIQFKIEHKKLIVGSL